MSVSLPINSGNGASYATTSSGATFSADGRFVVFASDASNLVPGDTNGVTDIFVADLGNGDIERISVSPTGEEADAPSFFPSISADGQFVAFQSGATNLLGGLTPTTHIFVKNRQSEAVILVDANANGVVATDFSSEPAISANGTFVVFSSFADNLTPDDNDPIRDVFRKNIDTGAIVLVSKTGPGAKGNGNSFSPAISADGQFVAFASDANNLVAGDLNGFTDIYRKEISGGVVFVSTATGNVESDGVLGNGASTQPYISADGNIVLFVSAANNLVVGDAGGAVDLFVKNLTSRATTRVNLSDADAPLAVDSGSPSLSADGLFVSFSTADGNVVAGDTNAATDVFVRDLANASTVRITPAPGDFGRLDADGSAILFQTAVGNAAIGDNNNDDDVYVYNFSANSYTLVSKGATFTEGADQISLVSQTGAQVSADGSRVVFVSAADNIVDGGNPTQAAHVYVRDRNLGITARISETQAGGPGNGDSPTATISQDGLMVAFSSSADNLVEGDLNDQSDIFVADFSTGQLRLISRTVDFQADGPSSNPVLSGNGRYVIFLTLANNLFDDSTLTAIDIVRVDLESGEIKLVTGDQNDNQSPASLIRGLSISDDGRYVAFGSDANGLVPGDNDGLFDVFVKDLNNGVLTLISKTSAGALADGNSYDPVISGNGQYVAFTSDATNLDESDANDVSDVYLSEWQSGTNGVVFRVSTLPDNSEVGGASGQPSIDRSGRHIAFATVSPNFLEGDTNNASDIFVKDTFTGAVYHISQSTAGARANGDSAYPSISADGRTVAYASVASTLDPVDVNGIQDVFATLIDPAPAANLSGDLTLIEGQALALSASSNEESSTFAWDLNGDGQFDVLGASANLTYSELEALGIGDGPSTVTAILRVSDAYGDSFYTFDLMFENVGPTPIISPVSVGTSEGQSATFSASATDPSEADAVGGFTWEWTATRDGLVVANATSPTFSFNLADDGHYTVTLVAIDKDGGSSDTTFVFDIANAAPLPLVTGTAGDFEGGSASFFASATDAGSVDTQAGIVFTWVVTLDGATVASGNGADINFTLVDDGAYILTVTATDKDGDSTETPFSFLVGNAAPTPAITPQTVGTREGESATFLASAADVGPLDTQAGITFAWTAKLDGFTVATGTGATFTFTLPDDGAYSITLVATDKDGGQGTTEFSFAADNVNPGPIISSGTIVALEGQQAAFTGSATDVQADIDGGITFAWTATRNGSTVATGSATTFSFVFEDNGAYVVTLTATDKDGGTASADYNFTVANVPPTVTPNAPSGGFEGSLISFAPTAIDPGLLDTATLAFTWSVTKNGTPYANGAGPVAFTPDDNGDYLVSVTATDKDGGVSNAATSTIIVANVNPSFTLAVVASVSVNALYTLNLTATDPGADTIGWSINWGDGSAVQTLSGITVTASHVYAVPATRTISITATDDDDGSVNHTQTLTVNSESGTNGPTIAIDGDASVAVNATYALLLGPINNPDSLPITGYRIAWGDSQITEASGTPPNFVSHTYLAVGERTIIVSLLNGTTPYTNPATKAVTITNVVTLTAPASVNEGSQFTLTIGSGAETATGYTITWGDGTTSGSVSGPPPGTLTHTYLNGPANRTITLTVVDESGSHVVGSTAVTVNNVAPVVDAGDAASLTVNRDLFRAGSFTDPGADTWTASVDYGDNTAPQQLTLTGKTFSLNHTYANDGVYQVTVSVFDGTTTSTDTFQLDIDLANTDPVITLASTAVLTAGQTLSLNGSFTDPDTDSWTAFVNYGDGGGDVPLTLNGDKTFSLVHQYNTVGSFTVTVKIGDGTVVTPKTVAVTVGVTESAANSPPVITLNATALTTVGSTLTMNGSFTDPDTNSWTGSVNYGDGSGVQTLSLNADKTFALSHVYTSAGQFTITVTINDGTEGPTKTVAVTVNAPPVITLNATALTTVGSTLTMNGAFTDPDTNSWTGSVNYGDGSGVQTLSLNADKTFALSHVYSSTGPFTITVKINDGTVEATKTVAVTVNASNVAPAVTLAETATTTEGGTVALSGSFTDPDENNPWTGTVNYGDGADQTLTLNADKTFALSHIYPQNGSFTITVSIKDGITTTTKSVAVTVSNVAPTVSAGVDTTLTTGQTLTRSGSFTDPGVNDTFTGFVDYGDGAGFQSLVLAADKTFSLSHRYTSAGQFTVTVRVSDGVADGLATFVVTSSIASVTMTLSPSTIAEKSPANTVVGAVTTGDATLDAGGVFTLTGSAGGRFAISGRNIVVADASLIDYETSASHSVTVRLTKDGQTRDQTFTITVTDADEGVDVVGRDPATGNLYIGRSTGSSFSTTDTGAKFDPARTWVDIWVADFTGDGVNDVIGRDAATSQWFLAKNTGTTFIVSLFDQWVGANWVDVMFIDANADGKWDIVGRNKTNGDWWACISQGTTGRSSQVGHWDPAVNWVDVRAGDVNIDGRVDLLGRVANSGNIHVSFNHASASNVDNVQFDNNLGAWTTLSDGDTSGRTDWVDFMLSDVNGDFILDVSARVLATGTWWVNLGTGGAPANSTAWGTWSPGAFVNVAPLDLSGEGKIDLVGRLPGNSSWFVAKSSGTKFAISQHAAPAPPESYSQFVTGDFNGDGSEDVAGYRTDLGQWDVGLWLNDDFVYTTWDTWPTGRLGIRSGRVLK